MKIVVCALAGFLVLPVFTASARGDRDRGGPSEPRKQPGPVRVLSLAEKFATDAQLKRIHDYIENAAGVRFVYEALSDPEEYRGRLASAIASHESLDLFWVGNKVDLAASLARGEVQDITDAVNTYGPNIRKLFQDPPGWSGLRRGEMWKAVTVNGRIWAVPSATSANTGVVLQVRKDWRLRLGQPPVTTIDELEVYLRRVHSADLDGNGRIDTIPYLDLYGDAPLEGTASSLTYAFTGSSGWMHGWYNPTYLTPEGGIAPTILHPRFLDFLRRMRRWYAGGLMDREVLSSNAARGNELIAANRVAAVSSWYSDFYGAWETLSRTVPGAEYEIAILRGLDGSPPRFTLNDPASPGWAYTAWSTLTRWGITLQDWFAASKDNYIVQVHGLPGVDWTWVDKGANRIQKTHPLFAFSLLNFYPWNGVPREPVSFVVARENAAKSFLAGQEGVWWPDWFVTYDWTGTAIAGTYADAAAYINKAIASFITGISTEDDWRTAVREYRKMWADEFSRQATALFTADG